MEVIHVEIQDVGRLSIPQELGTNLETCVSKLMLKRIADSQKVSSQNVRLFKSVKELNKYIDDQELIPI